MNSRLAIRRKNKLQPKRTLPKTGLRKFFKVLLAVVILGILVFIIVSIPRLIKITQINCQSQFGPCNTLVSQNIETLENTSYQNVRANIDKVLKTDFLVEKYEYKLNLPNTIDLVITERKPELAIVRPSDLSKFAITDGNGLVLNITDKTILPLLLVKQEINFSPGDTMPEQLVFAAKVLKSVNNLYGIKLATVEPDGIVVTFSDQKEVIFPLQGDTDVLFGSLSVILSRLNTLPEVSRIDLRFKNPVLK